MSKIDTQNIMALRANILQRNSALAEIAKAEMAAAPAGFTSILEHAVTTVSTEQSKASALATAYERGETNDIAAVMLQRQKASVAFETTLQVRNKLVSAYKDIMNMPL